MKHIELQNHQTHKLYNKILYVYDYAHLNVTHTPYYKVLKLKKLNFVYVMGTFTSPFTFTHVHDMCLHIRQHICYPQHHLPK